MFTALEKLVIMLKEEKMRDQSINRKPLFYPVGCLILGLALAGVFFIQCASKPPQNAKEFIEQLSAAYRKGDVGRIMSLEESNPVLDQTKINEGLKEKIKDFNTDKRRQELETDIQAKGMGYKMWTNSRYLSEKDHKDHIHVEVKVLNARSAVVLVRTPEGLKISLYPSLYLD